MSPTFHEVPLREVRPTGWIRQWLTRQREGLTGHLAVAGFPFTTRGWRAERIKTAAGYGANWWPYEQVAYWVDGMIRCGRLLGDRALVAKANRQLQHVLTAQDADGYLGPASLKRARPGAHMQRWPHAVFFRAFMAEYSATGRPAILRALERHYLGDTMDGSGPRDICNIEVMCWLYAQTGQEKLRERAEAEYARFNALHRGSDVTMEGMLSARPATEHGVSYNEMAKLGAVLFLATGHRPYLRASMHAYRKLDRDHMLTPGVPSSSERLDGQHPLASYEICDIADYTWSCGYLLMATRDAGYADKIERACFNAAPGAVRHDFKALQYFSCPNQVVAMSGSNHNRHGRGGPHMSYRPNPATECCPANVNRVMPIYAGRMWMRRGAEGVVAALYGPSRLTTKLGAKKTPVQITEATDYPFREEITFRIRTAAPVRFTLFLRIPGWCTAATLRVNGRRSRRVLKAGTFVPVRRLFQEGDVLVLTLPMSVKVREAAGGGLSVERGPLVYALPVEEEWRRVEDPRSSAAFPAWDCHPAGPWNYALAGSRRRLEGRVTVEERPVAGNPWRAEQAPVALRLPARRVPGWRVRRLTRVVERAGSYRCAKQGLFLMTPSLPSPRLLAGAATVEEEIRLVPLGCTHLRIALFPQLPA